MSRFESHRENVGRKVLQHSERLYINALHTSDGVIFEYRITGSVDTHETPGGAANVIGFICQLLAEFNNAQVDALEEREQRRAKPDDDDCECGEFN